MSGIGGVALARPRVPPFRVGAGERPRFRLRLLAKFEVAGIARAQLRVPPFTIDRIGAAAGVLPFAVRGGGRRRRFLSRNSGSSA